MTNTSTQTSYMKAQGVPQSFFKHPDEYEYSIAENQLSRCQGNESAKAYI